MEIKGANDPSPLVRPLQRPSPDGKHSPPHHQNLQVTDIICGAGCSLLLLFSALLWSATQPSLHSGDLQVCLQ